MYTWCVLATWLQQNCNRAALTFRYIPGRVYCKVLASLGSARGYGAPLRRRSALRLPCFLPTGPDVGCAHNSTPGGYRVSSSSTTREELRNQRECARGTLPSVHPFIRPCIRPSIHQLVHPSNHPSTHTLFTNPSVISYAHPFILLSIYPFIAIQPCLRRSTHPHPPTHESIYPTIHPSIPFFNYVIQ